MFIDVTLPLPLSHALTYQVPGTFPTPSLGSRVLVPFHKKQAIGMVTRIAEETSHTRIKPIDAIVDDTALIPLSYVEWLQWIANYYMVPLGEVLMAAFPAALWKVKHEGESHEPKTRTSPLDEHLSEAKEITLNPSQAQILGSLKAFYAQGAYHTALIHGVTGSGKTEIYLKLLKEVIGSGRSALFLVPEIGLTPQVISRLRSLFGSRMGIYHSGLTENQRIIEWQRALKDEVNVMVGTRSAVFAPLPRLGAVIIDEEHDGSYKQEERVRYHARDIAIVRARMEKGLVVLGSATPSLETYENARKGKYSLFTLRERPLAASQPTIHLVDLGLELRQSSTPWAMCPPLHKAIKENLRRGEQTFILINRRGFARSCFCLDCQKVYGCPNCSVNLVYHRKENKLVCHYCDYTVPLARECPYCHASRLTLTGMGTETVEDELKTHFPQARVARLDRDSTAKKGSLLSTLNALRQGRIDILVGTQMLAKGHDIPSVTLVGVMGVDAGLGLPDFRASEKVFQLVMQVSGRAGRAHLPGQVIVQTLTPRHDSIRLACEGQYEAFFERELHMREELAYPPSGHLIQFQFSSVNKKNLEAYMAQLGKKWARAHKNATLLGPAPAPIEKIRGRYRWHWLVKSENRMDARNAAMALYQDLKANAPSGVKWAVDVDPMSML